MKIPLFAKAFAGYLLIVVALTGSILFVSFTTIREYYINALATEAKNTGITLRSRIVPLLEKNSFRELDDFVKGLGKDIGRRITVILPDGVVVADSERDPRTMENHRIRPEIMEALKGSMGESLRFSSTIREEMLYVALPLENRGTVLGVVRVSVFLKDINALLGHLKNHILQAASVIALLSLLPAIYFSRRVTRPVNELSLASHRMAKGDFDVRIFLKTGDELQGLADSFNDMASRIRGLFAEVSERKGELNDIIASLQEGLVVIDGKDRVLLSNERFNVIVGWPSCEGRLYWEVLQDHRFGDLIKGARSGGTPLSLEITLGGAVYSCSATYSSVNGTAIAVLHDITDIKNIERIKREFVVNASHELKTPLTAIKGFVETMMDDPGQYNRAHLEIITKNTDRLIAIVGDLLLLTRLEERGPALEIEEVNAAELVGNTVKIFEKRVREKGLTLDIASAGDIPAIHADPYLLEQMLINLIDNAVKYTDKGGITISLERHDNSLTIGVRDTGIGIPRDHIPRIFERFYVVDKSRSRALGGTGLGLSIVKHIVLLHNGTIDVDSTPGAGTTFAVTLPLRPVPPQQTGIKIRPAPST